VLSAECHNPWQTAEKNWRMRAAPVEERPFRAAKPFRISDGFKPLWRRFVAQARFSAAC
jgi:hypothetical protein